MDKIYQDIHFINNTIDENNQVIQAIKIEKLTFSNNWIVIEYKDEKNISGKIFYPKLRFLKLIID